jgi:hypothetical protein
MTTQYRIRAVGGFDRGKAAEAIRVGTAIDSGMSADKVTYATPNPPLPVFQTLITTCSTAQLAVPSRAPGVVAERNVALLALCQGIGSQIAYVQTLVNANPASAIPIIHNVGLVVSKVIIATKPLLGLKLGKPLGSVACNANVGLLVGAGAVKPHQARCFNWQYTVDSGKTIVTTPTTSVGKTLIEGLPLMTVVGVRVSLTNASGPGPWSQWVTITVH